MPIAHDFVLPIRNRETLRKYVEVAFGVSVPNTRVCPTHSTPWDAFCDAYFATSPIVVWKASRGFGGKSYLLALLGLVEATTLKCNVNILGGSGQQSKNVMEHQTELWNYRNAPRNLLLGEVSGETRLSYGNTIRALMASQTSVRGPHPQRLRLDEVDEMDELIFNAALGQTMTKNGVKDNIVASSTHQYPDKTMSMVLQRAQMEQWPVHEWCWRETLEPHGWLSKVQLESKRSVITKAMWLAEYDLQEPSPEGRAIDTDAVFAMFKHDLGDFEGGLSEYIEIETPVSGATYSTGADWAKKMDKTEIGTIRTDVNPARLVAYEQMNRLPWPVMVNKFNDRVKRYPGRARHDGTGIGDVVSDYITVYAEGVIMVGRARTDMISDCISAIERGELEAPFIRTLYNELHFCTNDDVYGSGHLPDGLSMLALAWDDAHKVVSDDALKAYGQSIIKPEDVDDDMIAYIMDTHGFNRETALQYVQRQNEVLTINASQGWH
jgi:hypothetical protein